MNDQTTAHIARTRLTEHRHWPYRACAENPDARGMSAADETVPLTAWWNSDTETQDERHHREATALGLCGRCPIRQQCLDYALDHEPLNIWGGKTAYQRRELLLDRRTVTAPKEPARIPVTALDVAVLRALAAHRTETAVARAVDMTVTRANWHRARCVTFLHLDPRTTTRMRLLGAAYETGVLGLTDRYVTDRQHLAAIPSRQHQIMRSLPVQLVLPGIDEALHGLAAGDGNVSQLRPPKAVAPALAA